MTIYGLLGFIHEVYPDLTVNIQVEQTTIMVAADGKAVIAYKDEKRPLDAVCADVMMHVSMDLEGWYPECHMGFKAGRFYAEYACIPPFDDSLENNSNIGPAVVRFARLKSLIARNP